MEPKGIKLYSIRFIQDIANSHKNTLQFHNLVDCMVSTLNLPLVPVEERAHLMFDIIGTTYRNRMSLSILDCALQPAEDWSSSAFCQPTSKKAEKLCQIPSKGFLCFHYAHCI